MTEKKDHAGKPPLSGGKAAGIVGLGDLLKMALQKHGGIAKKPHKAPSRQYRRPAQVTRRRD